MNRTSVPSEGSGNEVPNPRYYRYPARVLGCLLDGEITVILCIGLGMADGGKPTTLPIQMVPRDLRMPNSEFDVQLDRVTYCFTKVLRKGEISSHTG